ncbi:hypothetical protein L208DRAFT_1249409, partial [Tricholoma matsutake]
QNDPIINSYNAGFILGWRANIDFHPVIPKEAVIAYVAKYASKGETSSTTYNKSLQTAISCLQDTDAAGIEYQKMLSSFVAEHNISGQETCHILLGCKLIHSSQQTRSLCVSPDASECLDFEHSNSTHVDITNTILEILILQLILLYWTLQPIGIGEETKLSDMVFKVPSHIL